MCFELVEFIITPSFPKVVLNNSVVELNVLPWYIRTWYDKYWKYDHCEKYGVVPFRPVIDFDSSLQRLYPHLAKNAINNNQRKVTNEW